MFDRQSLLPIRGVFETCSFKKLSIPDFKKLEFYQLICLKILNKSRQRAFRFSWLTLSMGG